MERIRFSPSGEYVAVSESDGRLRIWETATSILKQEFVPSSHLIATCTCIEWAPSAQQQQQGSKKKKRKRAVEGEVVVMGTAVGSILFYSVTKSQLLANTNDAHAAKVTGLSWSSSSLALYSCGEDGYIQEWDVENTAVTSRWKGAKGGLTAIRVFGNFLLSASQGITLWDLKTKTSVTTFTGHPGQINQLELIPSVDYFVTMSQSERYLRIWSSTERNSVATLSVPESPQNFHVLTSENGNVCIAVVTQKGLLHVYQHKLNGPMKKPLIPSSTLKIVDSVDRSTPVRFLASVLTDENDVTVLAGYGSWMKVRFEKFDVGSLEKLVTIERGFSRMKKSDKKSSINSEPHHIEVPTDVKHLQPGTVVKNTEVKSKKRKNVVDEVEKIEDGELPMEERLTNLTIDAPSTSIIPDGSNLAHVLSQGLHSKDIRILHSVLSRWDEEVVANTVRSLPVQLVVPLLNEIKTLLAGKAQLNHSILKWLKSVFQVHSAYLMSCPSSDELFGPFMSLLRTREALYPQMCQLRGKLELMRGNIEAKEHRTETANEALLVFHDESSDEDQEDDGILPSESEDFLASDDLGVDEESSSNSEADSDVEVNGNSDDISDGESPVGKKTVPKSKRSQTKRLQNGSEQESMDEDG